MKHDPIIHGDRTEVLASFVCSHTLVHNPEPDLTGEFDGDDTQRINFRTHWEKGYVEEVFPDGLRDVKGRCFTSSIFVEGRASGAPVFNSVGFVVGLNSKGIAPEDGLPYSTITSIHGLLDIKIDDSTVAEKRSEHPQNRNVKVTPLKPSEDDG